MSEHYSLKGYFGSYEPDASMSDRLEVAVTGFLGFGCPRCSALPDSFGLAGVRCLPGMCGECTEPRGGGEGVLLAAFRISSRRQPGFWPGLAGMWTDGTAGSGQRPHTGSSAPAGCAHRSSRTALHSRGE